MMRDQLPHVFGLNSQDNVRPASEVQLVECELLREGIGYHGPRVRRSTFSALETRYYITIYMGTGRRGKYPTYAESIVGNNKR